jgi:hypothetical protein
VSIHKWRFSGCWRNRRALLAAEKIDFRAFSMGRGTQIATFGPIWTFFSLGSMPYVPDLQLFGYVAGFSALASVKRFAETMQDQA